MIQPEPVGDLRYARTTFETEYGTIVSDWRKEEGAFYLHVEIPANSSGTVYFPVSGVISITKNGVDVKTVVEAGENGRPCLRVGSGVYDFVVNGN